jgi:hypothetical protein
MLLMWALDWVGAKLEKIFGQCLRYGAFMDILMTGQFCSKGPWWM